MHKLPKSYFGDISAEVMAEIADAMEKNDWSEFSIARCESRNHAEHRGELWQCGECLRVFCWAEAADDSGYALCDNCGARLHAPRHAVAVA